MPANLNDIVRDSKGFPDDLTISLTGSDGNIVEVPLKDIRQKLRSADADYTRKTQELAEQRRQFEQQQLAWAAQQQGRPDPEPNLVPQVPSGDPDLEQFFRPVYEKVYQKYDPIMEENKVLRSTLAQLKAETEQAMTIYVAKEMEREYRALPEKPTTEDGRTMTAKEFARWAVERGYRDSSGFPDFDRASNDYFGPRQREKAIADAKEAGRKEALDELNRQAFMGRPGLRREIAPGRQDGAPSQKPSVRNSALADTDTIPGVNRNGRLQTSPKRSRGILNDALSAAMEDPSIREGLMNLNRRE